MEESPLVVSLSPLGYSRKYLLAMLPAILYAVAPLLHSQLAPAYPWLPPRLPQPPRAAPPSPRRAPAWATTSEPAVLFQELAAQYAEQLPPASLLASLLTALTVDASRRATRYEVGDTGAVIRTGIWRRQKQTIFYSSIDRVILEQSLPGRLLNYGTIILVSTTEWGAENYARAITTGVERKGAALGAGYARVLKEISRDPCKCLYGVKTPEK